MSAKRTNWWQVILVLLIGAGAIDGFMWFLYNTYVPLYLQGGNPNFQASVVGFGLTPKTVGLILVLDNIAAFILAPIIGAWSDSYQGKWGRRMPFVLATVPVAAIAVALVPFVVRAIPPEQSGNLGALLPLFIPFLLLLLLIIFPLAIARTPVDALVYDLAPSKDRSKARSLGVILATLLAIGLGIVGSMLYSINLIYPFLLCLLVTAGLLALGMFTIKEPKNAAVAAEQASSAGGLKRTWAILQRFPAENKRSVLFLAANIFLGMFAFSLIQAFLSSYNMTVLGQREAQAGLPFLIAGATVMVVSFPAALLSNRIGRKRTMLIGCAGWAVTALLIYLLKAPALFIPLMVITGAFYGMWFVNSFVALVDSAPDDKTIGTMTAITGMANMAGMSVGPLLAGLIIEATGYDYSVIFPIQAAAVVLAFLALLPVKKCEVREVGEVEEQTEIEPSPEPLV